MRSKLAAFLLAVAAMVVIAILAIIVLDDNAAEAPSIEQTPTVSPTPAATPTPEVREPTFAPDGRTGDAALDRIIDDFLTLDATALTNAYADVTAREFTGESDNILPVSVWAARLAGSERSLYAVFREREDSGISPSRDVNIVLSVTEPGGLDTGWRLAIQRGKIVDLLVGGDSPYSSYTGDIGFFYELYLVLPPETELPQAPPSHALTTTTGNAGVDTILALLAEHDGEGLIDLTAPQVSRRECRLPREDDQTRAEDELRTIAEQVIGLHSVARLPEGHPQAGDHLMLLILEQSPYHWQIAALATADGRITGLDLCDSTYVTSLYPPLSYPAPPLADLADLDAARRSGIEVVDTFLNALAAGDIAAMLDLVVYQQVSCIVEPVGMGGPPFCEGGEPLGTVLDVLPMGQCEGFYQRKAAIPQTLQDLSGKAWALYSVADLGPPTPDNDFFRGNLQVVLAETDVPEQPVMPAIALSFSNAGLTAIGLGCGPLSPQEMLSPGRSPAFLLDPP